MLVGRQLSLKVGSAAGLRCFSVAAGEASEALEHLEASEGRLDRNRDGTKRLSFAIVGPPHLETVNRLLYATYHNYEPLTKHLGLCKGLNSMRDVDREVKQILVKNLTLLAYDDEGKPVGVAVNNSCCKEEMKVTMEEALEGVEESYRPIQAIHHTLRRENSHIYEEIGTDKMFSIRMIGVEVESRGQGVATNLIRRSILLAGCLGFRAIKAEATGSFGMKTFATVGMQPASSIRYTDFEYEGKKIFEGIGSSEADSEGNFLTSMLSQSVAVSN